MRPAWSPRDLARAKNMNGDSAVPPGGAKPPHALLPPGPDRLLLPAGTRPPSESRGKRRWLWILLPLVLIGAGAFAYKAAKTPSTPAAEKGKGKEGGRGGDGAPTPVIAARARKGNIGVYINGLGAVTPLNTVTVRSR